MMTNTYLPDAEWKERRNTLAGTMLMREVAALLAGKPVENPALVDAAMEAANLKMAEICIMPESHREADAA